MELGTFRDKLSTFTWIGRHASEMRFLMSTLSNQQQEILTISKSALETCTLAYTSPTLSTVHALGITPEVTALLSRIQRGESINISSLITVLCNRNRDGAPIPNTDLMDVDKLAQARRELTLAGIKPSEFVEENHFMVSSMVRHRIQVAGDFTMPYLAANQSCFDFTYAGLVFLNLSKIAPREDVLSVMKSFAGALKQQGVMGIGTTPFDLYGSQGTPALMEESSMLITDVLVDNLVKVGQELRGGYCLRGVKADNPAAYSCLSKDTIEERIAADPILAKAGVERRTLHTEKLREYLAAENNQLPLAALRGEGKYDMWEAPRAALEQVVPELRHTFGILPGLKY